MRKILFFGFCILALASCNNKDKSTQSALMQQRDSLNQVIAQRESEIDNIMSIVNEIEEGFKQINEAENRVSIAKQSEGVNAQKRIRESMLFIQSTMQQNRELIEKLRKQMRNSSFNSQQLKRTIENLTNQLEEKDLQIAQLKADLETKNIRLSEMDEKLSSLSTNVVELQKDTTAKQQTINEQDKQINTAWFVFGTKSELKEQRILVDGEVLQADFNKDYFTKIDIRLDKEIKLYSRSAKMLTSHPINSYTLEKDLNKQYVLNITDPQQFWSTSKYLVILVK